MIRQLIYVIIFQIVQGSIIQYDTNTYKGWDNDAYPSFICQNNINTQIISFSGTFINIPKVFITQEKFDIAWKGSFQFSITSVTLTSFTIQLQCQTSVKLFSYHVLWYAIDSPHIEVINCFNIDNPKLSTPYPHSNPDAIFGFITFTSFKVSAGVNFTLQLSSIDENNVIVQLSNIANILPIGYQIILGADTSFSNFNPIATTSAAVSQPITLENNKLFFLNYIGFNYNIVDDIRLQKYYVKTSTTITYQIKNWCCSYITNYDTVLQIPSQYILLDNAFKAVHMNIRSLEIIQSTQIITFNVNFIELTKQYSAIGSNSLIIDKTLSILNINIDIKCGQGNLITMKLNYCGQCAKQKPFEQKRYCFGFNNIMRLLTRFASSSVLLDKRFKIIITSIVFRQLNQYKPILVQSG